MAYDSDESGQGVDIFIQSFPDPRVKRVKVSPAHGSEPTWTRGGRELVYREGDKVTAVSIDLAVTAPHHGGAQLVRRTAGEGAAVSFSKSV